MSRRDQILATAAELFAARGFHGVSVSDLGAACGISGPALYKHFPSKDAMLAEMLVSISEELLEVGGRRVAEAPDPAAAVRALVDWHVEFALRAPLAHRRPGPRLGVAPHRRPRAGAHPPARRTSTSGPSSSGLAHDGLPLDRARAMAHAAFGLINSTPHSGLLPDPDMHALLRDMALRSLGV